MESKTPTPGLPNAYEDSVKRFADDVLKELGNRLYKGTLRRSIQVVAEVFVAIGLIEYLKG